MKVSQLLHVMDRDDEVVIHDFDAKIDEAEIFSGTPRGIKRDDPINKMHVVCVATMGYAIFILARMPRKEK